MTAVSLTNLQISTVYTTVAEPTFLTIIVELLGTSTTICEVTEPMFNVNVQVETQDDEEVIRDKTLAAIVDLETLGFDSEALLLEISPTLEPTLSPHRKCLL